MFQTKNGILFGGEVYDAELVGVALALEAAVSQRRSGEKIFVLLDNQAAVTALQTGISSSCLKLTRGFYNITRKL